MSFHHNIVDKRATLDLISYESPVGGFLSAPKNLTGSVINKGEDVVLTWEPPDTEVTIMGYEVFLEGNYHATVKNTNYTYQGMVNGTQYDFNVRAIGPRNIKSSFSNTATFIGGGLPDLDPYVFGQEFQAGTIIWQDVQDNQYYTIEGYNVYATTGSSIDPLNDKLNSSLLPLDVLAYTYFDLLNEQEVLMGVSYEYDGGQESTIYTDSGFTKKDFGFIRYSAAQKWDGFYPLIVGPRNDAKTTRGDPCGVKVKIGTDVTVKVFSKKKKYYREWTSPEEFDYWWRLRGNPVSNTGDIQRFREHCADTDGLYKWKVSSLSTETITIEEGGDSVLTGISKGFWDEDNEEWFSINFLWSGPKCPNKGGNLSLGFEFSINQDQVIEDHRYSDNNFDFDILLPDEESRLFYADVNGQITLQWYQYRGVSTHELYIRSKGTTDWGNPVYSQVTGSNHPIYEPSLVSDTYEAKVRYIKEDGSTYYTEESNIVEFGVV